MLTRFPGFEANRAIFFMVLATSAFAANSLEGKDNSAGDRDSTTRLNAVHATSLGLIGRLIELKFEKEEGVHFSSQRHWYFKPRRKLEPTIATNNKGGKISADNHYPNALPSHPKRTSARTASWQNSSSRIRQAAFRRIRRRKRSYNFDSFTFGPTSFPGGSMSMEDLSRARTKTSKIYHKATSSLLQIQPDGSILGVPDLNKYSVMVMKSVDHVDNMTMMKIYGNATKLYIAMKRNGVLYTTVDPNHSDTNFLHEYAPNNHDAFLSYEHRRYVEMAGANAHSVPAKAKRLSPSRGTPKRALFLNIPLGKRDIEELASQATKHVIELPTTPEKDVKLSENEVGDTRVPTISTEKDAFRTTDSTKTMKPTSCRKKRKGKKRKKGRCKRKRRGKGDRRKKRRRKGERGKSRKRAKTRTSRSVRAQNTKYLEDFDFLKSAIYNTIDRQLPRSFSEDGKVT